MSTIADSGAYLAADACLIVLARAKVGDKVGCSPDFLVAVLELDAIQHLWAVAGDQNTKEFIHKGLADQDTLEVDTD